MTSLLNIIAGALVNDRLTLDPPVPGAARGVHGEFVEVRRIKDQLMFAHRLNPNTGSRLAPADQCAPDALATIATQIAGDDAPAAVNGGQASCLSKQKPTPAADGVITWHKTSDAAKITGHQQFNISWWLKSNKIQFKNSDRKFRNGYQRHVAVITHNGRHHLVAADGSPFPINPPRHSGPRAASKVEHPSAPAQKNGRGAVSAAADGDSNETQWLLIGQAVEATGHSYSNISFWCDKSKIQFRHGEKKFKHGFQRLVAVVKAPNGRHHLLAADGSLFPETPERHKYLRSKNGKPAPPASHTSHDSQISLTTRLAAIRADAVTQIHNVLDEHLASMPVEKLVALAGRTEFTQRLYLALPQEDHPHA